MDNDAFIEHHLKHIALWAHLGPRLTASGIIGLAGPAGTGKDCAGEILAGYCRMRGAASLRMAFADKLYQTVALMTGIPEAQLRDRKLKDSPITWAGAPVGMEQWTPRKLLQYVGTEVARQQIDDLFWVRRGKEAMERALSFEAHPGQGRGLLSSIGFFSDVRFINEAKACDIVIELRRKGIEYTNDHASAIRLPGEWINTTYWLDENTDYANLGNQAIITLGGCILGNKIVASLGQQRSSESGG